MHRDHGLSDPSETGRRIPQEADKDRSEPRQNDPDCIQVAAYEAEDPFKVLTF